MHPFVAILLAALASFALGMAWYSPYCFGTTWQRASGMDNIEMEGSTIAYLMGGNLLLLLLMATGTWWLFKETRLLTTYPASVVGLFCGLTFVMPPMTVTSLYGRDSLVLWAINTTYQVLCAVLIATVIGYFVLSTN